MSEFPCALYLWSFHCAPSTGLYLTSILSIIQVPFRGKIGVGLQFQRSVLVSRQKTKMIPVSTSVDTIKLPSSFFRRYMVTRTGKNVMSGIDV